ncbi:MAG: VOC family protein [Caulobacteraceae bacterium]|nr:VOC family protein [Caulobacteraceae bacterium]
MSGELRHIAINADDVDRAKAFYEAVFGWNFQAWGPPDFFNAQTPGGVFAAVQKRREIVPGVKATAYECTIGVADLAATLEGIAAAGGSVVAGPFTIPTVGELAFFRDTEGNIAGVMQYEDGH